MLKYLYTSFLIIFGCSIAALGQVSLDRTVISNSGSITNSNNFLIESTVGQIETAYSFSNSFQLSQGFQQGNVIILFDTISFEVTTVNTSCAGTADGVAFVTNVQGGLPPYTVEWSTGETDTIVRNLQEGVYEVKVIASNGAQASKLVTIESGVDSFCELIFYSGLTPNSDGVNDLFIIDNVELFTSNKFSVYNRYGEQVRLVKNYNNTTAVWDGTNSNGNLLPTGTYFYIFEADGDARKGWVEITK